MSRLPNDCFAAPGEMISVEAALQRIEQALIPVCSIEFLALSDACGRILAEDIFAPLSLPPRDNSAVDGYAYSEALSTSQPLKIIGRSAAGTPFEGTVRQGECVKIFTGAEMPAGTDTIAMLEDCQVDGDLVTLPRAIKAGSNRRKAAEDVREGDLVLKSGTRLRPQEIARIASLGIGKVATFKPLVIGILSTGDELTEPDQMLASGGIYDSNRYLLRTLFEKFGAEVKDYGIFPDKLDQIRDGLATAAQECQMIVTSGGVSMGDEDHVKQAVLELGQIDFWRVAIKPGRPIALGQIGGAAFLGLPGNPVAAMVCAMQFGFTIAGSLMGRTSRHSPKWIIGPAAFEMNKKPGRREWLRGKYEITEEGQARVEKYYSTGSGLISSLTWANGLIEIPEEVTDIKQGDPVRFIPFGELFE